mmetsp:Transcript_30962/g.99366  ORF Transcript_30962/g.99366 Transcript_30962/m.99366 type:complete len:88 (-) Transcript_30962:68-331(-)
MSELPLCFSWQPKWPATETPLGLNIDKRTGEITGTPHFLGEIVCQVTCTDADGVPSVTELRFKCSKLPENHQVPRFLDYNTSSSTLS